MSAMIVHITPGGSLVAICGQLVGNGHTGHWELDAHGDNQSNCATCAELLPSAVVA